MNFNVADLLAVRARLERDAADALADPEPLALPVPAEAAYPAKRLVLQDGRYHIVDHDK